jgi:dolichol-phosphate mannosyltransferase
MLSVVIPVCNEEASLAQLHAELDEVARGHDYDMEIVLVDDGSTDGTWQQIEQLTGLDPRVRGIRLRRNFGKAAALRAAFDTVRGDIVFTLDGDLQDDPAEIPRFLEEMSGEVDLVSGWKKQRHDPWHKVLPSRVFNWLVSRMTGVRLHDHNCGFKCYRREVLADVTLYGEMHRFVPVLAAARGWKIGEIVVNHRPRRHGRSKYGVGRIVRGFLDLLTVYFVTGFGHRPLHFLGAGGLLCFLIGGAGLTILSALWVITRIDPFVGEVHLHEKAVFYYCIVAVLLGAQLMSMGFLAELLTAYFGRDIQPYSIRERAGTIAPKHRETEESHEAAPRG